MFLRTMTARAARVLALAFLIATVASAVRADSILLNYEFYGQPGNETSVAPINVMSGLTGLNFTEGSSLNPTSGANYINASGWTNSSSTAYYQFGFTIQAGESVTVDALDLGFRSSGGGSYTTVGTLNAAPGTTYYNETVSLTPVTAMDSLTFRFVAASQSAAAGGTISASGTFRVGDDNPSNSTTPPPFAIDGTITPASVPEPSSLAMCGIAGVTVLIMAHRRRKRSA